MKTRKLKIEAPRKISAVERELALVTPDFHGVDVKTMLRTIPYKISGKPIKELGFELVAVRSLPPNRDVGSWRLMEATAGIALSTGPTRTGAIESGLALLRDQSKRKIEEAHKLVASTIKRVAFATKRQQKDAP